MWGILTPKQQCAYSDSKDPLRWSIEVEDAIPADRIISTNTRGVVCSL
jgi:hypothetical protein